MKALAPNTMVQNRYLVVHLIGKGGMGDVYLAVDQRLGSAVALKRTFFADDQTLGNAFEREAKILARLRHPVLPKVSDHFLENSDQYLVMEHISGDDLSKRLEASAKPFPVSWVMFWADQLLDALSYLHSHEPPIIHRDIKPQNLKLTDDNHIVLLDFGLSKESGQTQFSKPGTSGSVVGYTPHFASMEQIRGTGTGPRSDIYSLSATLYQLVTNTMPADALTRADSLLNGRLDPITPPSDLNPEVSAAVSNVILKGLELRSEIRFASASEMQRALRTAHSQTEGTYSVETRIERGNVQDTRPPFPDPTMPIAPSEMATRVTSVPVNSPKALPLDQSTPPQNLSTPLPNVALEAGDGGTEPETKLAAAAGVKTSPGKKAKSGSFVPLALAGLFSIIVLAGIAVGGWYYFARSESSGLSSSDATPTPAVSPTPAPEVASPGEEAVSQPAETSTAQSANSEASNSEATSLETQRSGNTTQKEAVGRAKIPAAKSTPKPKPRDDRTILLQ